MIKSLICFCFLAVVLLLTGCDHQLVSPLCTENWCVDGELYANETGEGNLTDEQITLIQKTYPLVLQDLYMPGETAETLEELRRMCYTILSDPDNWLGRDVRFIGEITGGGGDYYIYTAGPPTGINHRFILIVQNLNHDDMHVEDKDVEAGFVGLFEATVMAVTFDQHTVAIRLHRAKLYDLEPEAATQ